MADEKKNVIAQNLVTLCEPENFQKYVLGTKSNGQPRAAYDVIKDITGIGKSKKKKKAKKNEIPASSMSFYMSMKGKKKKKKKKSKKSKHWHI